MPTDPEPTPLSPVLALSLAGFLVLGATAALTVLPRLVDAARDLAGPPARTAVSTAPPTAAPTAAPGQDLDVTLRSDMDVKRCFFEYMQAEGSLPPRVDVEFTIEPDGSVSDVGVTQSAFRGSELEYCLESAIKGITFPKASEAKTVTYPFILESR